MAHANESLPAFPHHRLPLCTGKRSRVALGRILRLPQRFLRECEATLAGCPPTIVGKLTIGKDFVEILRGAVGSPSPLSQNRADVPIAPAVWLAQLLCRHLPNRCQLSRS